MKINWKKNVAIFMSSQAISLFGSSLVQFAITAHITVQTPCVGAMLPDVVPEEHLTRVNGINGSLNSLFSLASPMLGALLLGIAPLGAIFFVDVITALIAIVLLLKAFVLPDKRNEEQAGDDYLKEMKLGVQYIARTKYLKEFFLFCIIFFLMMAPAAFLTQVQVVRNYGDDVWRLSAVEVAFSVGMLTGGVTIAVWGGLKNSQSSVGSRQNCWRGTFWLLLDDTENSNEAGRPKKNA